MTLVDSRNDLALCVFGAMIYEHALSAGEFELQGDDRI